ncbi:MAG: hypothetical protein KJ052_07070 [Candidatus Hydrogenedentes bacterium]|nr:hypothetical protein [Candidatus Hydrogenedentota bacterium]
MLLFYGICAAIGCTILLITFLLMLMGATGDFSSDVHAGDMPADIPSDHVGVHDHGSAAAFKVVTFQTLVGAAAFFGLTGLTTTSAGLSPYISLVAAIAVGSVAMVIMAWLSRLLVSLDSSGNVRIDGAVGAVATVYLSIPEHRAGAGKVTVQLQNRTMEYSAITAGGPLSTGTPVRVVAVIGSNTLEVLPLTDEEESTAS